MQPPRIPDNEFDRLQSLRNLNILDTEAEERFDRLTRLAQRMFDMPIVLISLVDANRQWFKSCMGLSAQETSREISFCGHAILEDQTFIVNDVMTDDRFADNPLVTGEPYIRFYAGYPLVHSDGSKLGTLCLIDQVPRTLTDNDLLAFSDVAQMVESELAAYQRSTLDELTGISNRQGFRILAGKGLQQSALSQKPAWLIYFDLDNFKSILGRLGRSEGERMLVEFSQVLGDIFADADVYARVGNDAFAALLTGIVPPQSLIRRLHEALDKRNREDQYPICCSEIAISIDYSTLNSIDSLLDSAEQQLCQQRDGDE
ncbi:hypothetical protein BGP75_00585 [Motiliproteus sp. MSK22-1]|nr:hypothetical protein BGP75_00585 [Motiliproteus sp. MSK22-1]